VRTYLDWNRTGGDTNGLRHREPGHDPSIENNLGPGRTSENLERAQMLRDCGE
jgi:hypothetical protein